MIPFAVVGSERDVIVDGKSVRGRKNRWGVVNVEDEKHCEFVYLRNFLTRFDHTWRSSIDVKLTLHKQDSSARPHRNDRADSLRGFPFKTATCTQRADPTCSSSVDLIFLGVLHGSYELCLVFKT